MPSSSNPDFSQLPHLSQEQQTLLLAALSSNSRTPRKNSKASPPGKNQLVIDSISSPSMKIANNGSRIQDAFISTGHAGAITFGDTLFPDYTESNTTFDVDFPFKDDDLLSEFATFGNDDNEPGEKRKVPDDEEDEEEEGDNKRREGDDKIAKKPGRKLITAEPTTKRKAQNRAAQRAFRERKEKHVKDLEQKVTELEKTTDTTTQENGILRAQIERLQTELQDYKKRISLSGNGLGASPPTRGIGSSYPPSNAWQGFMPDFQFSFSKFGETSDNDMSANGRVSSARSEHSQISSNSNRTSQSPGDKPATISSTSSEDSVLGKSLTGDMNNNSFSWFMPGNLDMESSSFGDLRPVVDPNLATFQSPIDLRSEVISEKSSMQNFQRQQSSSTSSTSNAQSPAASSSSAAMGSISSCGTSPEPLPNYNGDQLKTIITSSQGFSGVQLTSPPNPSVYDFTNIDWLSHQNGGQFDPVLFGDYRESQDAIVGDGDFSSGFFGDSYNLGDVTNDPFDFAIDTTVNQVNQNTTPESSTTLSSTTLNKPACANLMMKVERCRNGDDEHDSGSKTEMVTTHKLWTELQACPKFLSGEFDIDTLCSELSAKATCSETGMAVPKDIVEKVLWRLAGVPDGGDRAAIEQAKVDQMEAMRVANEQLKKAAH